MARRAEPTAGRSQRQLKIGEALRHSLARILERDEVRDPAVAGVSITVAEVRVSPDLKAATAYVMPLGGRDAPTVISGLRRSAPFLRSLLAREVELRHIPQLVFELDTAFDHASEIERLLHRPEVARDLEAAPRASRPAGDGSKA